VCDLETSRIGAPYIYNVRLLRVKMVLKMRRKSACEYKCIYVCEFIYVYVFISASPILFKIDWQAFIEIRTTVMPLENWNVIFRPPRKG
jgi:hypothetical protein